MKRQTNPLGEYASQFKGLTRQEESDLFTAYTNTHDDRVKTTIYNHNLRVIFILITYKHMYDIDKDELDDLIMVLAHHLWELIPKFKIEKGNRFTTFAQFCLYNKAKSYLKKMSKYNERFMSLDADRQGQPDATQVSIDERVIIEEFGEEQGYAPGVAEDAVDLLSLSQDMTQNSVKVGYGGRYDSYGEVSEFHFAPNEDTYNLLHNDQQK